MYKRSIFLVLILLFSFTNIIARDLYIDYLDGYLDIKSGNSWDPIDMGDVISESDIIKLSENGYAELLFDNIKITLDKDGTYEASYLIGQITKADKWGIKGSAFARLFNDDKFESRQSTVMGVRGDPQDVEKITWIDDDIEFLEEGKSLYLDGKFEEGLAILDEGTEWFGTNYDEIMFYKALCEYETGRNKEMRASIAEMDPESDAVYFGDFVLLKGNLLIESQDYSEAVELFDRYTSDVVSDDTQQLVYLLSAFCSLELNEIESAEIKLRKSIKIDPSSEVGMNAAGILGSL